MPGQKATAEGRPSFEQCLERVQTVVSELEGGNLALEESLRLFAEGIELVRCCQQHLAEAEQKVELLLPGAGEKLVRKPFVPTEEEQA